MPEQKLDLVIDVQTMNAQQIENVQRTMSELGISTDQLSDRLKTAMAGAQQAAGRFTDEAASASRASTAVAGMAANHENAARAAQAVTHGMSDMQNVLSNVLVNASMGGSAFSNLAWGLMFSPTSAGMAMTAGASAAYGLVQAMISAEQEAASLADRARDLAAANNISIQEGQAWAPVLDALGIKTNDLAKAQQLAADKAGSMAAVQQLLGDAAVSGAVATDQQTAAMLRQEEASAELSLAWQGLQLQLGSGLSPALTAGVEGWSSFIRGVTGAREAANAAEEMGHQVRLAVEGMVPPIQLAVAANDRLAGSQHDAEIAARNHQAQLSALEKTQEEYATNIAGVENAQLRLRQAEVGVQQAEQTLSGLAGQHVQDARAIQEATDKVKVAQDGYTEAVKKYGPASDQALKAHTSLMTAQDGLTKATNAAKDEQIQQTAAQIQADQAIRQVAEAAAATGEEQAKLAKQTYTAAQRAQDQIDALDALEATLGPNSPLIASIESYKATLESIPGEINTIVRTTHIVTQSPNVGNPQEGFTSAEGGVFTQPTLTWVGEAGPEVVAPLRPGNSAPGASPLPGGGFGADPHAMLELQRIRQALERMEAGGQRQPSLGSLLTGV